MVIVIVCGVSWYHEELESPRNVGEERLKMEKFEADAKR
jgi:hypothetical protein